MTSNELPSEKYLMKNCPFFVLAALVVICWNGCTAPINAPATGAELCVPKSVSFPVVPVGKSGSVSLYLASCSVDTVIIDSQIIGPSVFTFDTIRKYRIAPGDTILETIHYTPGLQDSLAVAGTVEVHSNAGIVSVSLLTKGTQHIRSIEITPPVFPGPARLGVCGDSNLGQPVVAPFTIKNTGSDLLNIDSIFLSGPFTLDSPTPKVIPVLGSVVLQIKFCPEDTGLNISNMIIKSDAMGNDAVLTVPLMARAVIYLPAPGSLWHELETDTKNETDVFKTVNDSNSHRVKRPLQAPDVLFVAGKGGIGIREDFDTSFYCSTLDMTKVMFYANAPYPKDSVLMKDSLDFKNIWLPFPLSDSQFAVNAINIEADPPLNLYDTVMTQSDTSLNIQGKNYIFHQALWIRALVKVNTLWYQRQTILLYSAHFGMIFIALSSEYPKSGKPRRYVHILESYKFR